MRKLFIEILLSMALAALLLTGIPAAVPRAERVVTFLAPLGAALALMVKAIILVLGLIYVLLVIFQLFRSAAKSPGLPLADYGGPFTDEYMGRNCQGIYWRRRFPDVEKEDIRKFLGTFYTVYLFGEKKQCRFHPDDKLMDIHNAYCLEMGGGDWGEVHAFLAFTKDMFSADVSEFWDDNKPTLGEIFDYAVKHRSNRVTTEQAACDYLKP